MNIKVLMLPVHGSVGEGKEGGSVTVDPSNIVYSQS